MKCMSSQERVTNSFRLQHSSFAINKMTEAKDSGNRKHIYSFDLDKDLDLARSSGDEVHIITRKCN